MMSGILKRKIKRLFSDIPIFYKLYFHLVRSKKGIKPSYFNSDTDLYLDAYPRSGSTFFIHILRNLFPGKKTVHHLHKIAPLKIAMSKKIITIILFRDPLECISSNYLKHYSMRDQLPPKIINVNLLKSMVEDYYYYYKFVLKKNKIIHLINFNSFVHNPSIVMYDVSKIIGYNFSFEKIEDEVETYKNTYKGATTKLGSSKPSEIKEEKKAIIKETLLTIPKVKHCKQLYQQLLEVS